MEMSINSRHRIWIEGACLAFLLALSFPALMKSQGKVTVRDIDGNYVLLRDGTPYYIKGAFGDGHLKDLLNLGGNTIRCWEGENTKALLDEAHKLGIAVCLGLEMGHENEKFNYNDPWMVKAQLAGFETVIKEYKDHPALLLWAIGNRGHVPHTNLKIWDAINAVAELVHDLDAKHPTVAVLPGIDVATVQLTRDRAPEIDILGFNVHNEDKDLPTKIRKYGWQGPFIITAWGASNPALAKTTAWKASIEMASSQKAHAMKIWHSKNVEEDKDLCLGSFVSYWGVHEVPTQSWYGLYLASGEGTEPLDMISYLWKGEWLSNRSPAIKPLTISGMGAEQNVLLQGGTEYNIVANTADPEDDPLTFSWEMIKESEQSYTLWTEGKKGDRVKGWKIEERGNSLRFQAPRESGYYRIYIYVSDGHNHTAYSNLPIMID